MPTLCGEALRAPTGLNSPDRPPWAFQPEALSLCPSDAVGCWSLGLPQAYWAQARPCAHSGLSLAVGPLAGPDPAATHDLWPALAGPLALAVP